ncbi:dynein regulatory complex protein 1 isoform X2 [Xiphias gladius]|uniref:dynein regulatory complex protein 1 isoform X2 n=1 Tax=Xiphias gladius TaxID=8245 RepID=UPI001A981A2C|nr:dynein regulatory complex protein 1 isoform X2 [Xiphias gladius]
MEEVDKKPEDASEPAVLSENRGTKSGTVNTLRVETQEADEDPSAELKEEADEEAWESLPQEEEEEEEEDVEGSEQITPQRITKLRSDLTTLVTNIQTAADARESMRRTELEEARRIRLERLENYAKSSQEKFEEITRRWSTAKDKVIPQELQEALKSQQQLCALLLEDKKKVINDLQQELKVGDDRYVKDLRKQAEELDLMMERMEDQIKNLTKAYREELAQTERVYQQESEILLTRDKTEWEQLMKELWDKELERLAQRKKNVVEYEGIIHSLMLETMDKQSIPQLEQNAKIQVLEREHQQIQATGVIVKLKRIRQENEVQGHNFRRAHMRSKFVSLQAERKNLQTKIASQEKQISKRGRYLFKDYKRNIQQYQCIQKKIKLFAVADARKFGEMWLTIEAEVKQLVERALVIDSLIWRQHLGLAWERPPMAFRELCGPIQPQTQAHGPARQAVSQPFHTGQASQCSRGATDTADGPRPEAGAESTGMAMCKEETAVRGESDAEVEEGKLSMETLKKVMELLCDEAGFLMEDKLLKLLAPLEKEEQTVVKLGSLLCAFGVEEEDVPKLALFLLKYKHQQREQTEDVCGEPGESSDQAEAVETSSTSNLTSDLIHPNHVLPALKSFLKQHARSRESSGRQQTGFLQVEARDSSEDEAYWESMANIISEDRVKLWEAAESTLKQYHSVLTEISELVPETDSLRQQNTELRMLLQQSLNS